MVKLNYALSCWWFDGSTCLVGLKSGSWVGDPPLLSHPNSVQGFRPPLLPFCVGLVIKQELLQERPGFRRLMLPPPPTMHLRRDLLFLSASDPPSTSSPDLHHAQKAIEQSAGVLTTQTETSWSQLQIRFC